MGRGTDSVERAQELSGRWAPANIGGVLIPDPVHPPEDNLLLDPDKGVAAVFDGLGGHGDGALASAAARDGLQAALQGGRALSAHELALRCRQALHQARAAGKGNPRMSSTCVVARRDGDEVQIAWCGDSRAYLISEKGWLTLVTEDHDLLYDRVMRSMLSPGAARGIRLKLSNVHTASDAFRAAGAIGKKAFKKRNEMISELGAGPVDHTSVPFGDGATLLLTTDGVHDNLLYDEMAELAKAHLGDPPEQIAKAFADAASEAGLRGEGRCHPDDITAVALRP